MTSVDVETVNRILTEKKVDEAEDLSTLENEISETEVISDDVQEENELVPPDGGWGWVVLAAGFFTLALTFIPMTCYGILYASMFQENNASAVSIAWIFNIQAFIWNLNVLMVGPLCEEYGWRTVSVVGGIFNSLSLIISAFIPRYEYLFFTFSTLGAIGGSTGSSICFFAVSKYFDKRRGLALGLTSLGVCAGAFTSPLLSNYLITQYGFQGAALIMGALLFHQSIAGTLYHPVRWHMQPRSAECETLVEDKKNFEIRDKKTEFENAKQKAVKLRQKQLHKFSGCSHFSVGSFDQPLADLKIKNCQTDSSNKVNIPNSMPMNKKAHPLIKVLKSTYSNLKSLRSPRVILIALASAAMMMGYANFQMWIPFAVRDDGHSLESSAWALSISAMTNTFGRMVTAFLSNWSKFDVIIAYMSGLLMIAVSIIAFTLYENLLYLYVCLAVWGYGVGMVMSLHPTVMIKTMGVEIFPAVYGISSLFIGFTFVAVGPLIGTIRDATSNFKVSLWVIAGMVLLAFLFWLMMPLARKYDLKREQSRKKEHP